MQIAVEKEGILWEREREEGPSATCKLARCSCLNACWSVGEPTLVKLKFCSTATFRCRSRSSELAVNSGAPTTSQ